MILPAYLLVAVAFTIWILLVLRAHCQRRMDRIDMGIAACIAIGCGIAWPLLIVVVAVIALKQWSRL